MDNKRDKYGRFIYKSIKIILLPEYTEVELKEQLRYAILMLKDYYEINEIVVDEMCKKYKFMLGKETIFYVDKMQIQIIENQIYGEKNEK